MKLSVVIPTYNRKNVLCRTLPSILDQDFPADQYEVVVVVDGSADGTAGMLRELRPACALRVIEQQNAGQAIARNVGVKAAKGQLVLFLDDDILCDATIVRRHVDAHGSAEALLVFGPVLVAPESPDTLATQWTREWAEAYVDRLKREGAPRAPQELWVWANCSAPRAALIDSGGYDGQLFRSHEDAELGIRMWKQGVEFRFAPQAVTHQLYTKSAEHLLCSDAHWYGRGELLLSRTHPEYRRHSALAGMTAQPGWKRQLYRLAATMPVPRMVLRTLARAIEATRRLPPVRRAGLRALQLAHRVVTLRNAIHAAGSWHALMREFGTRLPVLLYHHVGPLRPGTYSSLTVSPERFAEHVAWLARRGFTGIRSADWLAYCREGLPLPEKPVLLTFDDAYAELGEYALPVLRRHGFSATVFVPTNEMGGSNSWDWDPVHRPGKHPIMTAEQIRRWDAEGIEFGAHACSHLDLTTLDFHDIRREADGSRKALEEILGHPVVSFAYPYGAADDRVRAVVEQTFDLAFTVEEGVNDLLTDSYCLRRSMVMPNDSVLDLAWRLWCGWNPPQRLRSRLRLRERLRQLRVGARNVRSHPDS